MSERRCENCGAPLILRKPSSKKRFCNHTCAFAVIGPRVRAAASSPEAIKKNAERRRGRSKHTVYTKRDGRHEHRMIAEQKIGRRLAPGEVVRYLGERGNNDPSNLEVLSSRAELARRIFTGVKREPKTTCKFGHALVSDNVTITSAGHRRCLICQRDYAAKWKREYRAKEKSRADH